MDTVFDHTNKIAVLYAGHTDKAQAEQLANRLAVPLFLCSEVNTECPPLLFLCWREGRLCLLDQYTQKKGGLSVEFDVRSEQQRSWPAPKKGPLAQAIGRKSKTVVDATTGWGQDSFFIFRMGYQLICLERNTVMVALLQDGLTRLAQQTWMQQLLLQPPLLQQGDAIELLDNLDFTPDCIYLDPMFPPKRKKSALAKKPMMILHDLLGYDEDREQLFAAAMQATGKRVVVKSPDYAQPLGGKVSERFKGKLVRYDVYLK